MAEQNGMHPDEGDEDEDAWVFVTHVFQTISKNLSLDAQRDCPVVRFKQPRERMVNNLWPFLKLQSRPQTTVSSSSQGDFDLQLSQSAPPEPAEKLRKLCEQIIDYSVKTGTLLKVTFQLAPVLN